MQVVEHIPGILCFSTADGEGIEMPHDDDLVVEAIIHNIKVHKVLVDDRRKVNLILYQVFQAIKIPVENLIRDHAPVKGIGEMPVPMEGKIKLLLTLGALSMAWTQCAQFLMVKLPIVYNAILGRLVLYDFEVVTNI